MTRSWAAIPYWIVPFSKRVPAFVLDAGIVATWLLTRRMNHYGSDVQWCMRKSAVAVPSVWLPNLADILRVAELAGETTSAKVDEFLTTLPTFSILIDDETEFRAWADTLDLARANSLSVFNAAYLELALRLKLPLATIDPNLTRAAANVGVPIFNP